MNIMVKMQNVIAVSIGSVLQPQLQFELELIKKLLIYIQWHINENLEKVYNRQAAHLG